MKGKKKYTNFYDKKWLPNNEIKDEVKLHMSCANCEKLHILPDLSSDYFCSCGNHMVEYLMNKPHLKQCNLKAKDLEFKI